MSDAFIQVDPDGSGKKMDTSEVTVGAHSVHRERVVISDPATAGNHAGVLDAEPASDAKGITTRVVGLTAKLQEVIDALSDLTIEADSINLNTDQLEAKVDAVTAAVSALGPLTDAQLRATAVPVSGTVIVQQDTFTKKTSSIASSGNNTIHTPAAGKKIRLYYFGYSAGATVVGITAGIRFGAAGTVFDQQYLVAAGQPFGRNIQAGKRYVDGGVDEALVVNLSASAQTVLVNVELEEI